MEQLLITIPQIQSQPEPLPENPTAVHWAHQLFALFPSLSTATLSFEFIEGVRQVLARYPDGVLANVCSATHGIASKVDFFPSLASLRSHCDQEAENIQIQEKYVRMAANPRAPRAAAPEVNYKANCYNGPIEDIKPGDFLHFSRIEEYRLFMMAKHRIATKVWGLNERWEDTGQRPFDTNPKEETNPFEVSR